MPRDGMKVLLPGIILHRTYMKGRSDWPAVGLKVANKIIPCVVMDRLLRSSKRRCKLYVGFNVKSRIWIHN